MMWWLPVTRATLNPARSKPARPGHPARTAPQASGNINRESQLLRRAKLSDQALECLAQIGDSGLSRVTLAMCPDTGT
jgi:hypothetical protein